MASATTIVPDGVTLRWSALGPVDEGVSSGIEPAVYGSTSTPFASCQPLLSLNFDCRLRGTGVKWSLERTNERL